MDYLRQKNKIIILNLENKFIVGMSRITVLPDTVLPHKPDGTDNSLPDTGQGK